ncbi:MAG: RNA pseudouridine synthase [bacterium]|nr:RNA pseudouridine synthase [bacterium]
MLLVKTEKGLAHFKKLFQAKSEAQSLAEKEKIPLKKFYRALCSPTKQGEEFLHTIEKKLPFVLEEIVIPKVTPSIAKMGISKIIQRSVQGKYILVELEILTGRTHQIRYHLSHHGLPILGDKLYAPDNTENQKNDMQLTAYRLVFQDLDGEIVDIHI